MKFENVSGDDVLVVISTPVFLGNVTDEDGERYYGGDRPVLVGDPCKVLCLDPGHDTVEVRWLTERDGSEWIDASCLDYDLPDSTDRDDVERWLAS